MNNKFSQNIGGVVLLVAGIGVVLLILSLLAENVLKPLSPVITFVVLLVLTINTFTRWTTAVASVVGITIYAISWLVLKNYGEVPAMLTCFGGIVIWLVAIFRSFIQKTKNRIAI